MSHFVLKLVSGELVYGLIDPNEVQGPTQMVVVKNPMVWEEYEAEDGRVGSALVKFMAGTAEQELPFAVDHIVSMAAMSETFSKFYDAALEVQKITDEAYNERITYMTKRMSGLVTDYHAKLIAEATGGLVAYLTDTDTIH